MVMTESTLARIDADRFWADLMKIAEFTEPGKPYTRRSFSPLFLQARSWLKERFEAAGLTVSYDAAGNLIGRLVGTKSGAGTIMMGSHSDTVNGGGRFDGVAGVIAALEIARTLKEQGFKPRHNLEFVDFLAEEPNAFGLSCVGSRGMCGFLEERMLAYAAPEGETLGEAINRVGGNFAGIEQGKRSDIKAFFELHIEQGPILENECHDIGLVTAIVGIRRIEIIFRGEADHAGTTPMKLRRDAAAAMAEAMVYVRKMAEGLSVQNDGYFVATVGVVEVQPNGANVVPESARMIIDVRAENRDVMERFASALDTTTAAIAAAYRVDRDGPNILSELRNLLGQCAKDMRLSTRDLASGAGHDCAFIAKIAPAAMVFVPCRKGKSHASEEWAEPDALAEGANVIAEAIMRFDAEAG
jgi:N-carbamoyl-L-amino-acid hydrolase